MRRLIGQGVVYQNTVSKIIQAVAVPDNQQPYEVISNAEYTFSQKG
jgi:hypothetical protein